MIYLPLPPSRLRLQSFWCVLSLVVGLLFGYLTAAMFSVNYLASVVIMTLGFAAPGLLWSQIVSVAYRAFNKLAGIFAYCLTQAILLVCFCILRIAGRKNGSYLRIGEPIESGSLWVKREPYAINGNRPKLQASVSAFPQETWRSTFSQWAISSANWWMLALLPHMTLISIFSKKDDMMRVPPHVYSLY